MIQFREIVLTAKHFQKNIFHENAYLRAFQYHTVKKFVLVVQNMYF